MGFTNKFTGNPLAPSPASYAAIALTSNVALLWPTETTEGTPYFATKLNVTPSTTGLSLALPDATTGTLGIGSVITNLGSVPFTLTDFAGNEIVVMQPGISWLVYLILNTNVPGDWSALQIGATTSNANAGALAGAGLIAVGNQLLTFIGTNLIDTNYNLLAADRSVLEVWQGAIGTMQLAPISTLTVGWWCAVTNEGTGALTIATSSSQTINGMANLILQPGNSAVIVCGAAGFNTFGNVQSPLSVANGGTGANNATSALLNLGGSTIGISIFTAPSAAAVVALLGLNISPLIESTVNSNQSLTESSSNTAYVCIAALNLDLPLTTTLTTSFIFAVYAQGGAVTIVPQSADKINNGTAGANLVIAEGGGCLMTTDANGNWWPFFLSLGSTVTSVGLVDGSTTPIFAITNSPVTTSGNLTMTLVLENPHTALRGPTANAVYAAYNAGTSYGLGAQVTYLGINYQSLQSANIGNTPSTSPSWWEVIGGGSQPTFRLDVPADVPFSELTTGATISPPIAMRAYVASAALAVDLPQASTVTTQFRFDILAEGGNVTLTPVSGDSIQGGTASATFTIPQGTSCLVVTDAVSNWWLIGSSGGASSIVGETNGLEILYSTLTELTVQANQIATASSFGSGSIIISGLNVTLNISVTGANGMDTGTAAASADLSLYAIAGPGKANAVLACLGTTSNGQIYTGGNIPSGYATSALIGSYKMSGAAQFDPGLAQVGNEIGITPQTVLNAGGASSPTPQSISAYVPANTKKISGEMTSVFASPSSAAGSVSYMSSNAAGAFRKNAGTYLQTSSTTVESGNGYSNYEDLPLITPQEFYYFSAGISGATSANLTVTVTSYKI